MLSKAWKGNKMAYYLASALGNSCFVDHGHLLFFHLHVNAYVVSGTPRPSVPLERMKVR